MSSERGHSNGAARRGGRDWWVYRGTDRPVADIRLADVLPAPPPWRTFDGGPVLDSRRRTTWSCNGGSDPPAPSGRTGPTTRTI